MPNPEILRLLRQHLARRGCPAARMDRLVREIGAHLEEGAQEGRARGLSPAEAEREAAGKLGEPAALAERFMAGVRQAHWCGRHRVLAFGLLPTVGFVGWVLGWIALSGLLDQWFHFTRIGVKGVQPNLPLIKLGVFSAYYSGLVVVPAFFCWLAWTRCCGWPAVLLVCGSSALHGLMQRLSVTQDQVWWSYALGWPDWANVAGPALIGGLVWWLGRRGRPELDRSTPAWLAVTFLLVWTGCATRPPARERGWIGGEYKPARAPSPGSSAGTVPAFPKELEKTQTSGILVTALSSNAPAYLAGVRPGDLVLQVAGQPVTKLSTFQRAVDGASPGGSLALSVFRDGQTFEAHVTVGREVYRCWHMLCLEAPWFAALDVWPNPSFSLVALGYRRERSRIEIATPEARFVRRYGPGARDRRPASEMASPEGWNCWVPLLEVGGFKRIVSQEPVEASVTSDECMTQNGANLAARRNDRGAGVAQTD